MLLKYKMFGNDLIVQDGLAGRKSRRPALLPWKHVPSQHEKGPERNEYPRQEGWSRADVTSEPVVGFCQGTGSEPPLSSQRPWSRPWSQPRLGSLVISVDPAFRAGSELSQAQAERRPLGRAVRAQSEGTLHLSASELDLLFPEQAGLGPLSPENKPLQLEGVDSNPAATQPTEKATC